MKKILRPLLIAISFTCAHNAIAQSTYESGIALGIISPSNSFQDRYVVGLSLYSNVEIPVANSLFGNIEAGVQNWSRQELTGGGQPNPDNTFSIGGGGKYFLDHFFIEADAVYFFGDFNKFSIIPNTGLRFGKFNIELSISAIDPVNYVGLEIGYFWISD
jgi:hypothetical protein